MLLYLNEYVLKIFSSLVSILFFMSILSCFFYYFWNGKMNDQ